MARNGTPFRICLGRPNSSFTANYPYILDFAPFLYGADQPKAVDPNAGNANNRHLQIITLRQSACRKATKILPPKAQSAPLKAHKSSLP
jgi:hypothetical protein